jgi:hypothetical protein
MGSAFDVTNFPINQTPSDRRSNYELAYVDLFII